MFKMRKLLFILISSLATISLSAQNQSTGVTKFYIDGGGGAANHNGAFAELGATAVLKNNWLASVSYYHVDMNPKNLPSDYEPGYTLILFFPIPDAMPSVRMSTLNFTGGKLFPLGRKTWFTAEAGLSVVSGETFQFTSQPTVGDWTYISSNYSEQKKQHTTVGAMLRTNFNWAFTPFVGLSIGGFVNMNSIQSPVGVEFKLVAGWLNTKKKAQK
jgi:hypothetical protein